MRLRHNHVADVTTNVYSMEAIVIKFNRNRSFQSKPKAQAGYVKVERDRRCAIEHCAERRASDAIALPKPLES